MTPDVPVRLLAKGLCCSPKALSNTTHARPQACFLFHSFIAAISKLVRGWGDRGRRRGAKPEHRGGEVAAEEPRAPPPRSEEHRPRPLPVGLSQELRLTLFSRVEVEQPTVTRCSGYFCCCRSCIAMLYMRRSWNIVRISTQFGVF